MTRHLTWRTAEREDRPTLQEFTCTTPVPREPNRRRLLPHPKPWEFDVQSFIRTSHVPGGPDQVFLIGEDTDGIGAACLLADQGNPEIMKIQVIAVSVRHRGTGGSHADEAIAVALDAAGDRARAAGCSR